MSYRAGAGLEARACAPTALAVEDPIAGDPMPGLLEPQYVSLLQSERAHWEGWGRWKGGQNARTIRSGVVVVEDEGDVTVGLIHAGDDVVIHGGGHGGGGGDDHDHDSGHAAREGGKTDGGDAGAGDIAHRHLEGLVLFHIADRKSCWLQCRRARQQGQRNGSWAGIRP